ncbi:MAG: 50S ribosomal protein L32, partial [Bacteroidetes bacterium]|nr:50S ribosomal protein L32 [Bacteroidota bacterium]
KRKHSKARSRSRRANYYNRLDEPQLTECSNCGDMRQRHHACPNCGYYRGRQVKEVKAES